MVGKWKVVKKKIETVYALNLPVVQCPDELWRFPPGEGVPLQQGVHQGIVVKHLASLVWEENNE